jgi:hypothetical protein
MTNKFITAKQLAEMLLPYGDVPVKLRLDMGGFRDMFTTIPLEGDIDISSRIAPDTVFGDIPNVCRLTVKYQDNA